MAVAFQREAHVPLSRNQALMSSQPPSPASAMRTGRVRLPSETRLTTMARAPTTCSLRSPWWTAAVTVVAPVAVDFDYTISITPDTADLRDAVEASVSDYLQRTAEPGGTILLSGLLTAIGNTAGLDDFSLTSPAADVTHTTGQIAVPGTATFV